MLNGFHFHHLGVACLNFERDKKRFLSLGYEVEGESFIDERQKVRGCFLFGGGPRLELLEPYGENSPLVPWLTRKVKFYHLAYEVEALDDALAQCVGARGVITVQPTPAVAFGGREIAFVMFPEMMLIELIQRAPVQTSHTPE